MRDGVARTLVDCAALKLGELDDDDDALNDDEDDDETNVPRGIRLDAARGRLLVTMRHRVLAVALSSVAQQRAQRALPLVRVWALVQARVRYIYRGGKMALREVAEGSTSVFTVGATTSVFAVATSCQLRHHERFEFDVTTSVSTVATS